MGATPDRAAADDTDLTPSHRMRAGAFPGCSRKEIMPQAEQAHILVIDDDDVFCHLVRIQLTRAGYRVETAEDVIEGGKALLARPPDLVICDIGMPYMDGLELKALLKAETSTAAIPVIIATVRNDIATMVKAMDLGVADYLTKPVAPERLLDAVQAVLDAREKQRRETNRGTPPQAT